MKTQTKKWSKRTLAIIAFVILNVVVIVATAVNEFGNSANAAELSEVRINGWFLVPALLVFAVATLANIYKYVLMIRILAFWLQIIIPRISCKPGSHGL